MSVRANRGAPPLSAAFRRQERERLHLGRKREHLLDPCVVEGADHDASEAEGHCLASPAGGWVARELALIDGPRVSRPS